MMIGIVLADCLFFKVMRFIITLRLILMMNYIPTFWHASMRLPKHHNVLVRVFPSVPLPWIVRRWNN